MAKAQPLAQKLHSAYGAEYVRGLCEKLELLFQEPKLVDHELSYPFEAR